jgi:hypothetical protein
MPDSGMDTLNFTKFIKDTLWREDHTSSILPVGRACIFLVNSLIVICTVPGKIGVGIGIGIDSERRFSIPKSIPTPREVITGAFYLKVS